MVSLVEGVCMWVPPSVCCTYISRSGYCRCWSRGEPDDFFFFFTHYIRLKREWVTTTTYIIKAYKRFNVSALIETILKKLFNFFSLCVCNMCTERIENWDVNIASDKLKCPCSDICCVLFFPLWKILLLFHYEITLDIFFYKTDTKKHSWNRKNKQNYATLHNTDNGHTVAMWLMFFSYNKPLLW